LERLNASKLEEVVVTNTIPLNGKERTCPKLRVLSVAPLLGEAIKRIHEEESVSSLFV
jgi:ribose-phosphate pyrophosphokinase